MNAIIQKVPTFSNTSFAIQEWSGPYFSVPWHFHPEYELVLILSSEGDRFIGDSIKRFRPGDLVLIGSNIPHWYRNDEIYYQENSEKPLEVLSLYVQFKFDFLGHHFFDAPETKNIKALLDSSQMGLEIKGKTRELVTDMMIDMQKLTGMNKLLQLLNMLDIISNSNELEILSAHESVSINAKDSERINTIYEYVMCNFKRPISVEEVSKLLYMCPETFCRFFKKRTRKNFTYFLNEIRVAHACKMLVEKDLNISEVCFACGYNNISYFNRQFKVIKKMTPQVFKQTYRNNKFIELFEYQVKKYNKTRQ